MVNRASSPGQAKNNPDSIKISSRETEIIRLICDQHSSDEIADKLCLSSKTIKRHRQILFDKTGVKNVVGLVLFAIKNDIYRLYQD